jgi:pSer/pThr/pTyr-binding forkhead associated (FHA) protein
LKRRRRHSDLNGPWEGFLLDIPADGDHILLGRNDPPAVTVDIDMTDAELGDPPMVSRKHAVLHRHTGDGTLVIEDAGSTNGTWVDGVRLQSGGVSKPITPDVRLRIANIKLVAVAGDFTI